MFWISEGLGGPGKAPGGFRSSQEASRRPREASERLREAPVASRRSREAPGGLREPPGGPEGAQKGPETTREAASKTKVFLEESVGAPKMQGCPRVFAQAVPTIPLFLGFQATPRSPDGLAARAARPSGRGPGRLRSFSAEGV